MNTDAPIRVHRWLIVLASFVAGKQPAGPSVPDRQRTQLALAIVLSMAVFAMGTLWAYHGFLQRSREIDPDVLHPRPCVAAFDFPGPVDSSDLPGIVFTVFLAAQAQLRRDWFAA
jgi:hypothetical protein